MPQPPQRALPLSISVLMVGGICLIVGNAVSLWANLRELDKTLYRVSDTRAVINRLHEIRLTILDAQSGQRAFFVTHERALLEPFNGADRKLAPLFASLNRLATDPPQLALSKELHALTQARLAGMNERITLFDSGEKSKAMAEAHSLGAAQTQKINDLIAIMLAQEQHTYEGRLLLAKRAEVRTTALAGALSVAVLLLLALTYFLIRRNMHRREVAERALQALNDELESIVTQRTAQLSQLSWRLQTITEREKMALANELHDELGANLTAMNLDVAGVANRLQTTEPALAARLHRALKVLHETVELKRRVIHNLRPSLLDTLGVGSALAALCEDYTSRTGRPCHTDIDENLGGLDPEWPIAIYRIAQECFTNITKHANANNVWLTVIREVQGVRLRVVDDGIGIDRDSFDKPLSHGLRGMRERVRQFGGVFVVRSNDPGGTIAEAFLPFPGLVTAP